MAACTLSLGKINDITLGNPAVNNDSGNGGFTHLEKSKSIFSSFFNFSISCNNQ